MIVRNCTLLGLLAGLLLASHSHELLAAEPEPQIVSLNGQKFTIPAGFSIELAAGAQLVPRPISADFDEQGRLYVTDSSGTNERSAVQLEKKPHRILRLEDTNNDGLFDKSIVFAEEMMFPEGALWHAGSLYVAAPPSIWKLTDTDGDGRADRREEWFQGKTLTGCANDLHGPFLGRDGWIYWCKGAWAEQEHVVHGQPWKSKAAHIFRCRVDGRGLEPVMTGGMDNPVDVAILRNGDRIFTTTFLQHPAGGRRDGLIHAIYGGLYGKEHAPIYDHPWTSPEVMPILAHLGPAAPCGLEVYDAPQFGPDFADNLFAAQFNLRKVSRHRLLPDGGSYRSQDDDFVVSDHVDFHPTDVLTDADGSLLIVDTGGWYKLCCPTSQFHRPESLGGIYRVRKQGVAAVADPRGLKLSWNVPAEHLIARLADPRIAVQRRALESIGNLPQEQHAVVATQLRDFMKNAAPIMQQNAIWAAGRWESAATIDVVRQGFRSDSSAVQQVALQVVSLLRLKDCSREAQQLLASRDPLTQRLAAEALGRIGAHEAIPQLLALPADDRARDHAVIFALLEINNAAGVTAGLKRPSSVEQRRALMVLEQLPQKTLQFSQLQTALQARDSHLRETAWWIAQRHPEWGPEIAANLQAELNRPLSADEQQEFVQRLAKWANTPAIQDLLAEQLASGPAEKNLAAAKLALQALAASGVKDVPAGWNAKLTELLGSSSPVLVTAALTTIRTLPAAKSPNEKLQAALNKLFTAESNPPEIRLAAAAAFARDTHPFTATEFDFLKTEATADKPAGFRSDAVEALSRQRLTDLQLLAIAQELPKFGLLEWERILDLFQKTTAENVGFAVAEAFQALAKERSLRGDSLQQRLAKYSPQVQARVNEIAAALNADSAKQQERLEELLAQIARGDVRRGQAVYQRTKSACTACHAMAYVGGKVGPDLTRIGAIRTERDLLESILFPSASIVRSYEPVTIVTQDGQTRNGLIRQESSEGYVVALGPGREERIRKSEIEVLKPSNTSIMPAGLDAQLTTQELIDLVTYLKACR